MFKIGEFSKLTQVSVRMLRYYDETGVLKPYRIDSESGYRYYDAEQIPVLNKILFLRDLGFQITEIAAALNHWEDAYIAKLLEERRRDIEQNIRAEQEKLQKIDLAGRDIERDQITMHCNVSIKAVPGIDVISLRRTVPNYYAEGALWCELSDFVKRNHIEISSHTFSVYHDADYKEEEVDIELCAPTAEKGADREGYVFRRVEPVPVMACTMVYGSFWNISGVYRSFAGWLQKHNQYRMTGASRQIVHRGPWNEEDEKRYLTEIQIPLKER